MLKPWQLQMPRLNLLNFYLLESTLGPVDSSKSIASVRLVREFQGGISTHIFFSLVFSLAMGHVTVQSGVFGIVKLYFTDMGTIVALLSVPLILADQALIPLTRVIKHLEETGYLYKL